MKKHNGFTIVELLIVIVVIAILAVITVVSYQFLTNDARDASRRYGAQQIAKSIQLLFTKRDVQFIGGNQATMPLSADGLCQDENAVHHGGWVYSKIGYTCDVGQMLVANNMAPKELFDNSQPNTERLSEDSSIVSATMFYRCSGHSNTYVVYYYLKNPTVDETAQFNATLAKCAYSTGTSTSAFIRDRYKMKAAIELNM